MHSYTHLHTPHIPHTYICMCTHSYTCTDTGTDKHTHTCTRTCTFPHPIMWVSPLCLGLKPGPASSLPHSIMCTVCCLRLQSFICKLENSAFQGSRRFSDTLPGRTVCIRRQSRAPGERKAFVGQCPAKETWDGSQSREVLRGTLCF